MHDSTRRIICRFLFVALCLGPSVSLSAWILYRATPMHTWRENKSWADAIYQATGLIADVERVRHPTRHRTLLEGITLRDRDGEGVVARIRVVELAETDHGFVAIASQPEVEAHRLRRLGQLLYQHVLRGPRPQQPIQLLIGELTLHRETGASTFSDVRCVVASDPQRIEATIDFLLAGFEMQSPAQIQIARQRGPDDASATWQVRTGETALPCDLLADYLPALQSLGGGCHFRGTAWVRQDDRSWDGEVAGQFLDADLDSMVAPFPHKLSGTAGITISHSRFQRGKLVEAAGALSSGGGVISRSLLTSAAESLKLGSDVLGGEQADTLLAYRQLALGFHVDATGLQISGLCEGQQEGVVLVGTSGNLLLDSPAERIPSVAFARALVPQSELQVPATSATEHLLRALPLPSAVLPASGSAQRPYSPVKLR